MVQSMNDSHLFDAAVPTNAPAGADVVPQRHIEWVRSNWLASVPLRMLPYEKLCCQHVVSGWSRFVVGCTHLPAVRQQFEDWPLRLRSHWPLCRANFCASWAPNYLKNSNLDPMQQAIGHGCSQNQLDKKTFCLLKEWKFFIKDAIIVLGIWGKWTSDLENSAFFFCCIKICESETDGHFGMNYNDWWIRISADFRNVNG